MPTASDTVRGVRCRRSHGASHGSRKQAHGNRQGRREPSGKEAEEEGAHPAPARVNSSASRSISAARPSRSSTP